MITTVTLNPCIDRTVTVEKFLYGGTNRVTGARKDIAGKGINVSKALRNLGAKPLCLGFSYERENEELQGSLDALGIRHDFVEIPGELRTNVKIFDSSQKVMSELNESGHPVSAEAVEQFLERFEAHLDDTDLLVLTGSVPVGVPKDIYRTLMERAAKRGIRTVLDAAGELLLEGIKGKPYLIKPNIDELSQALGREFRSRDEIIEAARMLVGKGIPYVCVSLGAEGALLVDETDVFFAPALDIDVKGIQGAGDSLVAGFCLALEEKMDVKTMLCYASAAAAGSLIKEGTAFCEQADFERFLPRAEVKKIDEFFDIRTLEGAITGEVKARSRVHREGDWHGTAHMWVANRGSDGRWKLLIQRRSKEKDNYPGYCDISSAGHLSAGDDFEKAAYRELYEELGLRAEQGELQFLFFMGRQVKEFFHDHSIIDREIAAVYLYDKPVDIRKLRLQKEEVDEVFWLDLEKLEQILEDPEAKYCVYGGEIRKLKKFLERKAGAEHRKSD